MKCCFYFIHSKFYCYEFINTAHCYTYSYLTYYFEFFFFFLFFCFLFSSYLSFLFWTKFFSKDFFPTNFEHFKSLLFLVLIYTFQHAYLSQSKISIFTLFLKLQGPQNTMTPIPPCHPFTSFQFFCCLAFQFCPVIF